MLEESACLRMAALLGPVSCVVPRNRAPDALGNRVDGAVYIRLRMRRGYRALLGGQREDVNAAVDQLHPERFVQSKIVVLRDVVPVYRRMIHEVEAESGTDAGYGDG